jgi:hypothetical protein
MNGRLDPPRVEPPPPPRPPVPPQRRKLFAAAVVVVALVFVALGVLAWLISRRDAGPTVEVPEALGQPVPARAVSRLFDEAENRDLDALGLQLSVGKEGDRRSYRVGDALRVGFAASKDARCALFHRDARGEIQLVYPSGAGESATLRGDADPVTVSLKVSEPVGDESFLLACLADGDDESSLAEALRADPDEWGKTLSARREDIEVRRN